MEFNFSFNSSERPFLGHAKPKMKWFKAKHVINPGGFIVKAPGAEWEYYDPFARFSASKTASRDEKPYLQLANIDLSNEQKILKFVENYGRLGISSFTTLHGSASLSPSAIQDMKLMREKGPDGRVEWWEHLDLFREKAQELSLLIKLISSIQKPDYVRLVKLFMDPMPRSALRLVGDNEDQALGQLQELHEKLNAGQDPLLFKNEPSLIRLRQTASAIIESLLAFALEKIVIRPRVTDDGWIEDSWGYNSLLASLYLMLYLDSKNQSFQICNNVNCGKPFPTTNNIKLFCDQTCAANEWQRKYRLFIKEKDRRFSELQTLMKNKDGSYEAEKEKYDNWLASIESKKHHKWKGDESGTR